MEDPFPEKVDLRLEQAARNCGIDIEFAYEIWNTAVRPLLTVVDLPAITDRDDPRVLAVRAVDNEDAPVAQLAVTLAPALLLTRDHHLVDAGLGVARWADALGLVQQIAAADSMVNGSAALTLAGLWATVAAIRGAGRVLVRSPILAGLAIAVIFMLLTDWRESARSRLVEAGAASKHAGTAVIEQLADQYAKRHHADAQLQALLVTPGEPTTVSRVVRELAVAGPRSADQLAGSLAIDLKDLDALVGSRLIGGQDGALVLGFAADQRPAT